MTLKLTTQSVYTALALTAAIAFSTSVNAVEAIKVGYVNAARALNDSPQKEAAKKRIEAEFAPRDRKLIAQQKELRKLEDKLVRDGSVMTQSAKQRTTQELRAKKRNLQREFDEFREDSNLRQNQERVKLQKIVLRAIDTVARASGYDIVVGEGVLFAADRVNITNKVTAQLRTEFERARSPKKSPQ